MCTRNLTLEPREARILGAALMLFEDELYARIKREDDKTVEHCKGQLEIIETLAKKLRGDL